MTDGHTELPGGWCIPDDQMTGWPFNRSVTAIPPDFPFNNLDRLLTPIRGGMKYPTQKGADVPKKLTAAQELKLAEETRDLLDQKIEELREQAKREAIPPAPRESLGEAFSIHVKFGGTPRARSYRYLILRTPTGWYTTGLNREDSFFASWNALVKWLRQDSVAWHSRMVPLDASHADCALPEWSRNA